MKNIRIEIITSLKIASYIDKVSEMRLRIFKEYPYLYYGTMAAEKNYMMLYTTDAKATLALAYDDNKIIGISTGIPLLSNADIINDCPNLLMESGEVPADYYYYGEILLEREYRGYGISSRLYAAQDLLVKKWGFNKCCILTVMRDMQHPLKPENYQCTENIWKHLSFKQFEHPITTMFTW